MTTGQVLGSWTLDVVPTLAVLVTGLLYAAAASRAARRPGRRVHPPGQAICFALGLAVVLLAVDGPPDVLADVSFLAHMTQHLLVQMVAAPLLLLGGPVGLLLRADPPWCPRRRLVGLLRSDTVRVLTHPVTALAGFTGALVVSHFSGLYELALRHQPVHQAEHLAYLATALLFWWPAVGVDPAPHRPSPPARVLYLFLSMPVTAFVGVAIASSGHVLYPTYLAERPPWGSSALADQQAAGTLMWVAGMFTVVPAMGLVLWQWLESDSRQQQRRDALQGAS